MVVFSNGKSSSSGNLWAILRILMSIVTRQPIMQVNFLRVLLSVALLSIVLFCVLSCSDKIEIKWQAVKSTETEKLLLKVYVESSGSMDGYMCDGAELKDAMYGYLSKLSTFSDSIELNYINSQIIPYTRELKFFIKDLTPLSFHNAGGNTGNSDIADMLDKILKSTGDNVVSIFVSDCILDVPDGSTSDFFVNRQIDIQNAFTNKLKHNKNLGVEICRLESTFKGWYYYHQGKEYLENVKRPYYMWIIGDKNHLARLNKNVLFTEIPHGVRNYFAYSTLSEPPFEITNESGIKIKGNSCVCNPNRHKYNLLLKVDMRTTLQDGETLCVIENYKKQNSFVAIERIDKILAENTSYTHLIRIAVKSEGLKSVGERLALVSLDKPNWMESANDDSGRDVMKNIDKTTGIKYLIQGVSDAYKKYKELAEVKFVISKK